ncbi:winged helix-turn-helix domain-containing protein [bacterium]|nr:winged helix-turn-helix domain-containing protein [bacterium]
MKFFPSLLRFPLVRAACDRPLKDIAADLGITPETLSRALTKLERDGAITRQQNAIILRDVSATW